MDLTSTTETREFNDDVLSNQTDENVYNSFSTSDLPATSDDILSTPYQNQSLGFFLLLLYFKYFISNYFF